jgi:Protein of unknown function (DUF3558)
MRWALGALAVVAIAGGCSGSSNHSAAPTTTLPPQPSTTTTTIARTLSMPANPCALLTASETGALLPGATAIPRPGTRAPTISTAGCSWRVGGNSLDVEIFKDNRTDPFHLYSALLQKPKPVDGIGDQAVESDNLTVKTSLKMVVILVRDADLVVQVTARNRGQLDLVGVETATRAALSRLT